MTTRLEHQLIEWHNRNYGEAIDVPGTFRHLLEEVGELGEALLLNDQRKIREEAGDAAVLLFHVLRGACPPENAACNPASLSVAMAMALEKCIGREEDVELEAAEAAREKAKGGE